MVLRVILDRLDSLDSLELRELQGQEGHLELMAHLELMDSLGT